MIRDGFHTLEKRYIIIGFLWGVFLEAATAWLRISARMTPSPENFLADFQLQTIVFYAIIFILFYFLWRHLSERFMLVFSPVFSAVIYLIATQPVKKPFPDVTNPLPTMLYLLAFFAIAVILPFYITTHYEHEKKMKESIALSTIGLIAIIASLLLL